MSEYLSSLLQVEVIPVDGEPGLTSFKQEEWAQNSIILFENLVNFRGEVANCKDFSQKLASGATISVNDSFSLSHKILSSTVHTRASAMRLLLVSILRRSYAIDKDHGHREAPIYFHCNH